MLDQTSLMTIILNESYLNFVEQYEAFKNKDIAFLPRDRLPDLGPKTAYNLAWKVITMRWK